MLLERHFIFGSQDMTQEVLSFLKFVGVNKEIAGRLSVLIISQILDAHATRTENAFKIVDEILHLEGMANHGESQTKLPTMFNRKPHLKGLWHKHFMGSGVAVMATNLKNALNAYGTPESDAAVAESMRTEGERALTEEEINQMIHESVRGNYLKRSQEKKITGHWIVYAIHKGENYYLSLGKHTNEIEIRQLIESKCLVEFPFLSEILHPVDE